MRTIIYNAIKTPDGTILESDHRYDCGFHADVVTGKTYMIDGGLDYIRSSNNGDEQFLTVYSDSPHENIRSYAYRLGYGKPGTSNYGKFRKTLIKDMSDAYLQASLDYKHVTKGGIHWRILLAEKLYRIENEISIEDDN